MAASFYKDAYSLYFVAIHWLRSHGVTRLPRVFVTSKHPVSGETLLVYQKKKQQNGRAKTNAKANLLPHRPGTAGISWTSFGIITQVTVRSALAIRMAHQSDAGSLPAWTPCEYALVPTR